MRSALRIAVALATALLAATAFAADDKPAAREISRNDLKIAFPKDGKPTEPAEFKSADELAKSESLKDATDELKKRVDFAKEKLVFFAWKGSGGDKITPDEKTPGTFILTRGKTRDLRSHIHLFALPKDAAVKIVTEK